MKKSKLIYCSFFLLLIPIYLDWAWVMWWEWFVTKSTMPDSDLNYRSLGLETNTLTSKPRQLANANVSQC